MSTQQLLDLYTLYANEVGNALPEHMDFTSERLFQEVNEQEFYGDLEEIIEGLGDESLEASEVFGTAQADLAEQDYLENFRRPDYSLMLLADFVYNAVQSGLNIGGFSEIAVAEGQTQYEAILSALLDELGEDWTPDQFANLVSCLTNEYYETRDTAVHTDFLNEADTNADLALGVVGQYEQALALDQLRAFAFDPNWNPEHDSDLLDQLLQAAVAMPATILGNDVSWVQRSFINYHNAYKQYHNWRLQLKADLELIELQMLDRQEGDDERSPLWWVGVIGETLLGFNDVFDAILTIRDIAMYGDWLGLGFLALDIAVP
ncbi:MAG: hypothetical protein WBC91_05680, partial [Phototrophicaceae bacterium]